MKEYVELEVLPQRKDVKDFKMLKALSMAYKDLKLENEYEELKVDKEFIKENTIPVSQINLSKLNEKVDSSTKHLLEKINRLKLEVEEIVQSQQKEIKANSQINKESIISYEEKNYKKLEKEIQNLTKEIEEMKRRSTENRNKIIELVNESSQNAKSNKKELLKNIDNLIDNSKENKKELKNLIIELIDQVTNNSKENKKELLKEIEELKENFKDINLKLNNLINNSQNDNNEIKYIKKDNLKKNQILNESKEKSQQLKDIENLEKELIKIEKNTKFLSITERSLYANKIEKIKNLIEQKKKEMVS
ncbi:MAG: hypothetical protein PHT94_03675 [Candidatus Nanoarchaeia archaeon]|nr:hypothetical protein [Candidatus Nanoarchaeia archaeon]